MTLSQQIRIGMAKAFFCSAYADMAEESDNCPDMTDRDWMDVLPGVIDPAALHAAATLLNDMCRVNNVTDIAMLYSRARHVSNDSGWLAQGDREFTGANFGHYCAMQAMGHGVGLADAFGQAAYDAIEVPYVEFGAHSLSVDYFL